MRRKIILVILLVEFADCARILAVIPTPSISHQVVFRPLIQELVKRGHECVVVTTDPAFPKGMSPQNLTEIDVHDITYAELPSFIKRVTGEKDNNLSLLMRIFTRLSIVSEKLFKHPEVENVLRTVKFDLVIAEAHIRPMLGLSHHLKAPMILMSTVGGIPTHFDMMGAPTHPIFYPHYIQQKLYNLTFFEKLAEIYNYARFEWDLYCLEDLDYEIIRRNFAGDVPSFRELYKKYVQLIFLNEHPLWADNRPVPPNIKFIGGIHNIKEKPLPKDLKNYLDAAKRGVIYFSLGSNVKPSILHQDKMGLMLKVLSRMPYEVLFKWDNDNYPNLYENIKFFRWMPQSDVLNHPNIKVFITQGGLQSTDEAINAAVPLIGMPIFGDQYYNVEKYEHLRIGLQLDINTVTEEEFYNTLNTVISDVSYKNNIIKLRAQMREMPIDSLNLAVWWTEHVLNHGGSHLRSRTAGLTWIEYYEIPFFLIVFTIIMLILLMLILVVGLLIRSLWRFLTCGRSKIKTS